MVLLSRLSPLVTAFPLLFGAPPAGEGAPAIESSKAEGSQGAKGDKDDKREVLPTDDTSRPLWYRPSTGEGRPPSRMVYHPLALEWEPQVLTGGARGGTLSTFAANLPVAPAFGFQVGAQIADTVRPLIGFDFFRYTGYEFPITRVPGTATISALIAPTFGIRAFFLGGVVGSDIWTAPIGARAIVEPISSMVEMRLALHGLVAGETDPTGATSGNPSAGGSLGLEIVVAPLLIKREIRGPREEAPPVVHASPPRPDPDDEEEERPKKKRKKADDDDDASLVVPGREERTAVASISSPEGGAR